MTADDSSKSTPVEYRNIPGAPHYRVSNDGRVQSCRVRGRYVWTYTNQWRNMNLYPDKRGRCSVILHIAKKPVNYFVHRLVLEAFVGPCPPGMECRHLDGDPTNNHISNLAWGTPKENAEDRERHGRTAKGEKQGYAKLTADDVREIVSQAKAGVSQRRIASAIGTTQSNVWRIVSGDSWNHVTGFPKRGQVVELRDFRL